MMKVTFFRCGIAVIAGLLMMSNGIAQHLPSKDTLMKQMVTANQYFMDKWPDPGKDIVTDKVRPSNLWTRATYYEGLMALFYVNPDPNYFNYAVDWGRSHDWEPTYGNLFTRDGDHQCCGQTYIELYQLVPDSSHWIEPITVCMDNMVESEAVHDWSWIDAIQMAMPVFAKLGVVHQDTSYFRKMHEMYMFSRNQHGENGLYNTEEHLWYRDADFDPPFATPNDKSCYWSRGNGWVIAALVRVLDVIPDTLEYREEYIQTFTEMAEALIAVQREDGFWNASLFDPEHYGGEETSGTAFFTYGLAWGINNNLLDSATYMPHVIKGWNAMAYEALHSDGFLGYVQSTGKQPSDGYPFTYTKPANFEDYGLGAFLLAGSETYKLAPDTGSMPAFASPEEPEEEPEEPEEPDAVDAQLNDQSMIKVFPNPAKDHITFQYQVKFAGKIEISIFNVVGEKVLGQQWNSLPGSNEMKIDLNGLPGGIYLGRVDFNNRSENIKFFVSG